MNLECFSSSMPDSTQVLKSFLSANLTHQKLAAPAAILILDQPENSSAGNAVSTAAGILTEQGSLYKACLLIAPNLSLILSPCRESSLVQRTQLLLLLLLLCAQECSVTVLNIGMPALQCAYSYLPPQPTLENTV